MASEVTGAELAKLGEKVDALEKAAIHVDKDVKAATGEAARVSTELDETRKAANAATAAASRTSGMMTVFSVGAGLALIAAVWTGSVLKNAMTELEDFREKVRKADTLAEEAKARAAAVAAAPMLRPAVPVVQTTPLPPKGKLKCITRQVESGRGRYPAVTVTLDEKESEHFFVTGGGCRTLRAGESGAPHNIPTITSVPVPNGWQCSAGDPPNLPVDSQVFAHLIACAVE